MAERWVSALEILQQMSNATWPAVMLPMRVTVKLWQLLQHGKVSLSEMDAANPKVCRSSDGQGSAASGLDRLQRKHELLC